MANFNLTGQKIKNTYGQLAQVSSSIIVDGLGSETQISASNIENFTTEVSKSAASSGFGQGSGDGVSEAVFGAYTSSNDARVDSLTAATSSYLTSLPSGVVSSSAQVDLASATGVAVSASHAITASFALNAGGNPEWDNIQNKPSGLVSGSSQVSYNGISDVPSGIVSGAAQLPQIGTNETNIATLTSATSSYLTSLPSGVVSGSSQIDLSQATGTAANATSASYAVSASHLIGGGGGAAGLVAGTGTDSMRSSDDLTTTAAVAGGNYSVVLGEQSTDGSNNEVVAIGFNNEATQRRSVVIGLDNTSNGDSGIVIGNSNSVGGQEGIVLGVGSQATQNSITIGGGGANSSNNGVTVGNGAAGGGQGAVVLGYNAAGDFNGAVAIGNSTTAQANNAIVIGNNKSVSVQENNNEINIGDKFRYSYEGTGSIYLDNAVRVPTETLSGAGGTVSVDGVSSNYFYLNNGGSTTTISNPTNIQDGATYTFKIDDGRNITWGAAYKWPNGVVPTFSSGSDIISFVSIGGTNLYGTAQYNFQ